MSMELEMPRGAPPAGIPRLRANAAPRRPRHFRGDAMLAKYAVVLLLPAAANVMSLAAGAAAHLLAYLFITAWALGGPRRSIEALTLSWLATFLNPAIYTASGLGDVFRWMAILAALTSIFVHFVITDATLPRAWFWVVAFVLAASGLAVHSSYMPDVSLFKTVSFLMGTTAVLLGFHLTRREARYWRAWFSMLFAVVVVAGFPLIAFSLGYTRNGRGFQGLTGQPQTYSLFLGPLVAWLLARLITREERGLVRWGLVALGAVSLIATEGRTGLVAAAVGLGVSGLWWVASGRVRVAVPRAWIVIGLFAVSSAGVWVAANWQTASRETMDFLFKGRAALGVETAFYASRGFLIEASMANFREHPLTGIGFGVASDPTTFIVRRDPVLGLPLGAPTEKGFTLVAILEEIGLIGMAFFLMMLAALLRPVFSRRAPFAATVLAVSALAINFGEAVFFAVGGSGMLVWLLVGAARVMATHED